MFIYLLLCHTRRNNIETYSYAVQMNLIISFTSSIVNDSQLCATREDGLLILVLRPKNLLDARANASGNGDVLKKACGEPERHLQCAV